MKKAQKYFYTDPERRRWELTGVRRALTPKVMVEGFRVEDGKPVSLHWTALEIEEGPVMEAGQGGEGI